MLTQDFVNIAFARYALKLIRGRGHAHFSVSFKPDMSIPNLILSMKYKFFGLSCDLPH